MSPAPITLYALFVLTGIVTTLLGPALPVLVGWWSLDDAGAGLLFTAQFAGSMVGSALSGVAATRVGLRATLLAGVAAMAAGVGLLAAGTQAIGTIAIVLYGIGLGLTIPATNLYIAEASGARRASALNILNLAWGVGAVAAPALVALFDRGGNAQAFLIGLACALALMAIPLVRVAASGASVEPSEPPGEIAGGAPPARAGTMVFGAFLFLYVGTESSVAGWIALHARRLDVIPATLSIATPSLFWAALLAGRAAAPLLLRRVPETRLMTAGLIVATAGVGALLLAASAASLTAAVAVGGLGFSTIFPLAVAWMTRDLGRTAATAAGSAFVLAGLGGAVLPPLVGFISRQSGSLTAGLLVPLSGCAAMLALCVIYKLK